MATMIESEARQPNTAVSTHPLSIAVVAQVGDFAALRPAWGELLAASRASIFNSWEWLYPWYQHLGGDRQLYIMLARGDDGQLLGLLPLSIERRRVGLLVLRRLAFLGDTHVGSDYLDVVARAGYEQAVLHAFARQLFRSRGDWDVLDLTDIDEASPLLPVLRAALGEAGYATELHAGATCPYEEFAPGTQWEEFLRGTARRDNYLRRRKWLEKQPGFAIERIEASEDMSAALDDFLRLHALRWEAAGGSDGISGQRTVAFHYDAARLLAEQGQIRFYTMRVDGEPVASVYGMLEAGKFIYYQSGYDPDWRARSVGLVLVAETFKDCIEAGRREYDFLRGTECYKSEWTTRTRHTVGLRAYSPNGRGSLLSHHERGTAAARNLIKRTLPAGMVEQLRRVKRQQQNA